MKKHRDPIVRVSNPDAAYLQGLSYTDVIVHRSDETNFVVAPAQQDPCLGQIGGAHSSSTVTGAFHG